VDLHASTALYGNVSTLSVSPVRTGLVAVGTDDGLVQVTTDDGASWHETDRFPEVPEMMKAGMVAWSSTMEGTLFAVFDGHKDNVFRPFVVRSDDYGKTWRDVTGDLPGFGPTRSVAVHPQNGDLIFVGTEFGVFASNRGGERWIRFGEGLPTAAVHGIVVHPRENDLVLGTHGRGFWVLDDIGLLEGLTPEVLRRDAFLATPRRATQIRDANRGRGSVGDTYWTAQNPPRGAILDYWIGEAAVGSAVRMDVLDDTGQVVRTVAEGAAERGGHRLIWDLRHEAPPGPNGRPSTRVRGRFVLPGSYQIRLWVGNREYTRPLSVRMDPVLSVDEKPREALDRTLALQADLVGAAAVVGSVVDTVAAQAEVVLEALSEHSDVPPEVAKNARAVRAEAQRLRVVLSGPGGGGIAQQETVLPIGTLVGRLYSTTEAWTGSPTEDQRRLTRQAHGDMVRLISDLRALIEQELQRLRQAFTEAGIPWPAGEAPTLPDNLIRPYAS
jgi:hypothetical protein